MMIFLAILAGLLAAVLGFGAFIFFGDRIRVFTSKIARTHSLTSVFPRHTATSAVDSTAVAASVATAPAANEKRSTWNKVKEKWILAAFGAFALGLMVFGPHDHKTTTSTTAPTSAVEAMKASEPKKSFLAGLPIVGHYFQGPPAEKVATFITMAVQQVEASRGLNDNSYPYGDRMPQNILGLGCPNGSGLTFDQAFSNLQKTVYGNSQQKEKFDFPTDWQFHMGVTRNMDQLKRDRTPRDILTHWDTEVKGYTKSHRAYDDALVDAFVSVSGGEFQLDTPCSRLVNASIWDYQIWKPARLLGLLLLLAPWLFAKTIRRMTPGMQIHELFCWVYWLAAGALDAAVFVWVFVIPLFPDRAVGSPLPDGPTLVAAFFGLCTAALARDTIFNVVPAKAPTKTAEKDTKEDAQGKQGKNKK